MKNIGDASASTSVTVIGGGDVPAYIPIWYDLSVLKPVLLSVLAAVAQLLDFIVPEKIIYRKCPRLFLISEHSRGLRFYFIFFLGIHQQYSQ